MRRCRQKAREFMSNDRLTEDKNYLMTLATDALGMRTDVDDDTVKKDVSDEANSVLDFLNLRQEFWSQLNMGQSRSTKEGGRFRKRNPRQDAE